MKLYTTFITNISKWGDDMERWIPIIGYEKYYMVSNFGRVKSLPRDIVRSNGVIQHRQEHIKHLSSDKDGYKTVALCVDGASKKVKVHILVARAFVDGWFNGAEVNHKDFDKSNNNADNLEWMCHKDNVNHAIQAARHICTTDLTGSNNPNYQNHKLHDIYASNKSYAMEKQSRCGARNGRSTKISMLRDKFGMMKFCSYSECASFLVNGGYTKNKSINYVSTKISEAIANNKNYLGFRFFKD